MQSHRPSAQKGPVLNLTLCCSEILNFQTRGFRFHFTLSPINYVASVACHVFLTYIKEPDLNIPWNLLHSNCVLSAEEERNLYGVSFIRALIPFIIAASS